MQITKKKWIGVVMLCLSLVVCNVALTAAESIEIVYWSMWNEDEPQAKVIQKAITSFQQANPNVTFKAVWNGRENRNLVGAALEANEQIDLLDTGSDSLITFNIAPKWAISLEKYLDQPTLSDANTTVRDVIVSAILNQYPVEGEVVMVPYGAFAVMFFYNKDHFEKAGITKTPETWEEFMMVNEALKQAGYAPITTDMDAYVDILLGYAAERTVGCDGFISAITDKTGEAWRDPAWLQMAQNFRALLDNGYLAEGTDGNLFPAGQQALALGEVSMYLNGTWLPTEVASTTGPDFRWGAFSFPNIPGGKGSNTTMMMGAQAMIITKLSAHPDEAFEFLKHLISKEIQEAWINEALVPPVRVDVEWSGAMADAGKVFQQAEVGIGWSCDMGQQGEVIGNVVMPVFTDLFIGKLTPEEYVEKMVTESANFWKGRE